MTTSFGPYHIAPLQPSDVRDCERMTFPSYKHMLGLRPNLRLPSEPDQRQLQPVALTACISGDPVALVLGERPVLCEEGPGELLSVFVAPEHRGYGLGTRLVEAMELTLGAVGVGSVEAVYTTGKPSIVALERIFEKRGWVTPARRTITVRFTMAEAMSTPWYGRPGMLPDGAGIFLWSDLTDVERRELRAANDRAPWIPNGLQPWRHDRLGFDPLSSVGLRYRGEVVGWVINHQIDARTVRFTCSFMRKDLSRRARSLPLYSEALRRLSATACEVCTFVTYMVYPEMCKFIQRHCAPYASFTGETRGTHKAL